MAQVTAIPIPMFAHRWTARRSAPAAPTVCDRCGRHPGDGGWAAFGVKLGQAEIDRATANCWAPPERSTRPWPSTAVLQRIVAASTLRSVVFGRPPDTASAVIGVAPVIAQSWTFRRPVRLSAAVRCGVPARSWRLKPWNWATDAATCIYLDTNIFVCDSTWMDVVVFAALAEPKRMRIVEILREGPASVGELAAQLTLGQPQTSKHLKTLSDARLVAVRAVAQRRIYHLRPEPFRAIDAWLDSYRPTWDERIEAMERYLQTLTTGSSSNQPRK